MTRHPTPADIMYHISMVLADDAEDPNQKEWPMPARVNRLMREGVSRACVEAEKETAA